MAKSESDDPRQQPMGELVKELSRDVSALVRQELELAKAEASEKGRKAGLGAGLLGGAGAAGLLALGALTAAVILALDLAIPAWAAALVVTAIWAAVAGVLALRGREKVQEVGKPVPEKTVETVKEDVEWLNDQTRSGTR